MTPQRTRDDLPQPYPFDEGYPLEDPYEDIGLDDFAYSLVDWDKLDPRRVADHDDLLHLPPDQAAACDLEPLDDLQRLAVARALLRAEEWSHLFPLLDRLVASAPARRDPLLSYPDLALERALLLHRVKRYDDALRALDAYDAEPEADPHEGARARVLILMSQGRLDEGAALLHDLARHLDRQLPEAALFLGDDLAAAGHPQAAAAVYQAALAFDDLLPELRAELQDALDNAQRAR